MASAPIHPEQIAMAHQVTAFRTRGTAVLQQVTMPYIPFIGRTEAHDVKQRQFAKLHVGVTPSVEIDVLVADVHRPCGTEVKVIAVDQYAPIEQTLTN
jgi:hypothetical protein